MRIIQRAQRSRDVRQRRVLRSRFIDFLPRLAHPRVPIQTMKLRIVIMLLHVRRDVVEHQLRALPFKAPERRLLGWLLLLCEARGRENCDKDEDRH